jgi:outer membrane protein assembly factor BamD (BamD/ComL family)
MQLPIIHMNGTSAETLLDGYRNAMNKLQEAIDALGTVEFNARDYYVEKGAWDRAVKERREQMAALRKVHEELTEIAVHCYQHKR